MTGGVMEAQMMDLVITRNPQGEGTPRRIKGYVASLRTVGPDMHPKFLGMPQVRYHVSGPKPTEAAAAKWAEDRFAGWQKAT